MTVALRTTGSRSSPARPGSFDEPSGDYYLHLFSRKQPDLDWENPEVRQAVYAMMRWWVDRGVDGFRMDVINLISKDPRSCPTARRRGSQAGAVDGAVANGPRLHEFFVGDEPGGRCSTSGHDHVGEMPGAPVQDVARVGPIRPARELNMVFTFEHVNLDVSPGAAMGI